MFSFLAKLKSEVMVGVLVLSGIGLVVYSSIKVTGFQNFNSDSYQLVAYFNDVSGLSTQTAVRVSGIKVGIINSIELERNKAKVTMTIFSKYKIPVDSNVTIKSLGLLGDKYIEIVTGSSLENMSTNSKIDSQEAKGIEVLLENLTDLSSSLKRVVANNEQSINKIVSDIADLSSSLKRIAESNEKNINAIFSGVAELSASLNRITASNEQNINRIISNVAELSASLNRITASNEQNIDNIFSDVAELSASLNRITTSNEQNINGLVADLKAFTSELKIVAKQGSLNKSITNLESITKKIDEGEGTLGQLVNESETVEKINIALDDISNLLGSTSRWKYDVGFETKYLGRAGGTKSDFEIEINTQKDRFYLFKITDHPAGKIEDETVERVETDASGVQTTTTTKKKTTTDDYLFSLQLAKRFYDTQFRIGFFESSFGVGLDQYFGKDDSWRITSELFDFAREELPPQLVVASYYRLFGGLYLNFGLNDALHSDTEKRDYFIGVKLEFNEDNLRILGAGAITNGLSQ